MRAVGLDRGRNEVSIPLQFQGCGPVARPIDLSPPPAIVLDKDPTIIAEGLSGEDALLSNSQSSDVQHEVDLLLARDEEKHPAVREQSQLSDFVLSQDDQDNLLIRAISGCRLDTKTYFVTRINTSNPVWMKKAQLKTRTWESTGTNCCRSSRSVQASKLEEDIEWAATEIPTAQNAYRSRPPLT